MQPKPRILLVDGDDVTRALVEIAAAPLAHVESHRRFETARARLIGGTFDFLVTNVRLGAYNGLHLVYLGSMDPDRPRAIVYSDGDDAGLAREVQRAGAFYEAAHTLTATLAAYVKGPLPDTDRRHPAIFDRRDPFRGGRRCRDLLSPRPPAARHPFAVQPASESKDASELN